MGSLRGPEQRSCVSGQARRLGEEAWSQQGLGLGPLGVPFWAGAPCPHPRRMASAPLKAQLPCCLLAMRWGQPGSDLQVPWSQPLTGLASSSFLALHMLVAKEKLRKR